MKNHWVADIFPLNESDIERLAEDIKANGQRNPILVFDGMIVDGRTRFAACKKLGVKPLVEEYKPTNGDVTDDELLAVSWSLNEARRHLTTSQRACAAAEVMERNGVKKGGIREKGAKSKNRLCDLVDRFKAGRDYMILARELLRESPDLFRQVKAGELTVGAAHEAFKKTKELEQQEVKRNSLAEIRSKNEDLAEQVENGSVTVDDANRRLDEAEEKRRARKTELSKIATGLFVMVSGIQQAEELKDQAEASIQEIIETRTSQQSKEDAIRLKRAIATLEQYLAASKG